MTARYCVECGNLVTTAFCPSCGAIQPTAPVADERPDRWRDSGTDDTTAVLYPAEEIPPDQSGSWGAAPPIPPDEPAEQPWHPFEQPSWYSNYDDPRASPPAGGWSPNQPNDAGPDFMGVSSWQTEPPPQTPPEQRRSWLLGGLAVLGVVAVLVVVAILVIKSQRTDSATPTQPSDQTTQSTASVSTTETRRHFESRLTM